jgi:hypothetical protein
MNKIKNLLLILFSIFFSLILIEFYLIFSNSYTHLVKNNLIPSNTIWTNQENSQITYSHPDLNYPVKSNYGKSGVKANFLINKNFLYEGFFGDSVTDNRRIEYDYNFTSFYNEIIGKNLALNFGVDGFGLDQSFIRYLNIKNDFHLSKIFYVFHYNDLANILQTKLFELKNKDELVQVRHQLNFKNKFFRLISKRRLTYFVMSSYQKIIGKNSDIYYLKDRFIEEFVSEEKNFYNLWKPRFFAIEADSVNRDLFSSSPSNQTVEAKKIFNSILDLWIKEAKSQGSEFYIVVLPEEVHRNSFKKIINNEDTYKIIYLKERFPNLKYNLSEGHWNEVGNLSGALDLADYFKLYYKNDFVENKVIKIKNLYKDNKSEFKIYKNN